MARAKRPRLPVNADQLRALGEISVRIAYTDILVEELIQVLLDTDLLTARVVLREFQVLSTKLTLLENLAERRLRKKSHRVWVKRTVSHARTVNTERNKVIHGIWVVEGKRASLVLFKGETKYTGARHSRSTRDLFKLADDIDKVNIELGFARDQFQKVAELDSHLLLRGAVALRPQHRRLPGAGSPVRSTSGGSNS